MPKQVSNADIYTALGRLDEKVDQIHDQVRRTNGRVTKLELDEAKRQGQEGEREKESGRIVTPAEKEGWTSREKTLTAIITALLAIVGALVGAGKL